MFQLNAKVHFGLMAAYRCFVSPGDAKRTTARQKQLPALDKTFALFLQFGARKNIKINALRYDKSVRRL